MALFLILVGAFLLLIATLGVRKFQLYSLLTALGCCILSIELLADLSGLTLALLSALTLLNLLLIRIKLYDIAGCMAIVLPCTFWLSTQEFVDGFAYSHIIVALGVALASILLFDKKKRQTLCALVLLTSFVICYASNMYFNAIDIATSFLIAVVFTESFDAHTKLACPDRIY